LFFLSPLLLFLPLRAQAITITPVDFDTSLGSGFWCDSDCPVYDFGEVTAGETGSRTASFDVTCTADDFYCEFGGGRIGGANPNDVVFLGSITRPVDCRLCGAFETVMERWTFGYRWQPDQPVGGGNLDVQNFTVISSTTGATPNQEFVLRGTAVAAAVPIPPAVFLFASALGVLGWLRRRTA
jgi:hypothetical protein